MKRSNFSRLISTKLWLPILVGGIALQTNGCDPTVRTTILTGLQTSLVGLVTSIMNAFFMALQSTGNSSGSSTTQSVVQAAFDSLKHWVA